MAVTHNEAAVLRAIQDIAIETIPVPEPGDNEVLLKMGSVGICGSDIMYWKNGGRGKFILKAPMIIGHEGSGTVVKVGSKVRTLKVEFPTGNSGKDDFAKPFQSWKGGVFLLCTGCLTAGKLQHLLCNKKGDRVAIEPGTPCRRCDQCKSGSYNLCPYIVFCATPPDNGNICRYYKHAADFCFKIPDHMSLDEGALVEPMSVAIYACRRGEVTLGSKVLICGAGPAGIMCMMVAKASGASQVSITDIDDSRLQMAKTLGADHVVNVRGRDATTVASEIASMMEGKPNTTIECSSTDYSFELGIHATKPGGCLVGVGRPTPQAVLPIGVALTNQVDIRGLFRYVNCYPTAIEMISSGKIDVKPMITHHFPLRETLRAFETFSSPDAKAVKVVVNCDQ